MYLEIYKSKTKEKKKTYTAIFLHKLLSKVVKKTKRNNNDYKKRNLNTSMKQ